MQASRRLTRCLTIRGVASPSTGTAPGVIFRWRADGTSTSPGTLSPGVAVSAITRAAPFNEFKYASFDGASAGATPGYVGDDAIEVQPEGFTVQAWIRAQAVDGTRTIFSSTGSNKGISFDIRDGALQILFSTDDGGAAYRHTVKDATAIETGRWYSVAVSVARTSQELRVAFFVDGLRASESKVALDHGSSLLSSTEKAAVAGEPTSGALEGEGFDGDMHAVMVHNYPVGDDILGAPFLREGGRYLGMPSYHDYLKIPEGEGTAGATPPYSDRSVNLARRIELTDADGRFPGQRSARVRLGLPLLNDRFMPSGVAVSDDGTTMWIGYHFRADDGTNPDKHASVIAEADLTTYRLRKVYRLHDMTGAPLPLAMGGLAQVGGRLYATAGKAVVWFDPANAQLEEAPPADMPSAPGIYQLKASESFAVRVSEPGIAWDPARSAFWLSAYSAAGATLDRYDVLADGHIAHPSEQASDERLQPPASVHHVRGVVPYKSGAQDCFLMTSHDSEAVGAAKATRAVSWCVGREAAPARLLLAAGAQAITIGPDGTLWILNQSGAGFYQKRKILQQWYDVLNPYVSGWPVDAIQPKVVNCEKGAMEPWLGDVHTHTSYSDGIKLPADLFAEARDDVGLDFTVLTDHGAASTTTEYSNCKKAATSATSAKFVAACGFEISMKDAQGAVIGHGNVLFADKVLPYPANHKAFYALLAGCKGCLGQINHPASVKFPWTNETWSSVGDPVLALCEFNGATFAASLAKYQSLLDHGWHLAPSMNSDTHALTPGSGSKRTGLFAATLDLASIKEAIKGRRMFAGNAGNGASLRLQAEDCWMGARLQGFVQASLLVEAIDPAVGFTSIDLLVKGGKKLHTFGCSSKTTCSETAQLDLDPAVQKYVIAVATRTDGRSLVSAPIWLEE